MTSAQTARFDVLVRGGRLVDSSHVVSGDVGIRDGRVEAVLRAGAPAEAATVIDARGCYVLPGILDVHVHPPYADDMRTLSVCGAHGGVTTLIHFIGSGKFSAWGSKPDWSLGDAVKHFAAEGERISYLDFGFHAGLAQADDYRSAVPEAVKLGVSSFKMFMAYKSRGMMLDDDQLLAAMEVMAEAGALAMVHAENGGAIDYLEKKLIAAAQTAPAYYIASRPAVLEREATARAIALAQVARCPLYVVHVSCREAMAAVVEAKAQGQRVYGETCPHYLVLTDDEVKTKGAFAKIGPPLRTVTDIEALWQAVAVGHADVVASDHGAFTLESKRSSPDNIFAACFGVPGVETLLPLLYHFGVHGGRIPITRLVDVLSERPAKIFNLYPRKGSWQVGADADLVILDPAGHAVVTAATQHSNAGYSAYEGMDLRGRIRTTLQRGRVVLDNGELKAQPGWGQYLSR